MTTQPQDLKRAQGEHVSHPQLPLEDLLPPKSPVPRVAPVGWQRLDRSLCAEVAVQFAAPTIIYSGEWSLDDRISRGAPCTRFYRSSSFEAPTIDAVNFILGYHRHAIDCVEAKIPLGKNGLAQTLSVFHAQELHTMVRECFTGLFPVIPAGVAPYTLFGSSGPRSTNVALAGIPSDIFGECVADYLVSAVALGPILQELRRDQARVGPATLLNYVKNAFDSSQPLLSNLVLTPLSMTLPPFEKRTYRDSVYARVYQAASAYPAFALQFIKKWRDALDRIEALAGIEKVVASDPES